MFADLQKTSLSLCLKTDDFWVLVLVVKIPVIKTLCHVV